MPETVEKSWHGQKLSNLEHQNNGCSTAWYTTSGRQRIMALPEGIDMGSDRRNQRMIR
jgi:hypothetical protein